MSPPHPSHSMGANKGCTGATPLGDGPYGGLAYPADNQVEDQYSLPECYKTSHIFVGLSALRPITAVMEAPPIATIEEEEYVASLRTTMTEGASEFGYLPLLGVGLRNESVGAGATSRLNRHADVDELKSPLSSAAAPPSQHNSAAPVKASVTEAQVTEIVTTHDTFHRTIGKAYDMIRDPDSVKMAKSPSLPPSQSPKSLTPPPENTASGFTSATAAAPTTRATGHKRARNAVQVASKKEDPQKLAKTLRATATPLSATNSTSQATKLAEGLRRSARIKDLTAKVRLRGGEAALKPSGTTIKKANARKQSKNAKLAADADLEIPQALPVVVGSKRGREDSDEEGLAMTPPPVAEPSNSRRLINTSDNASKNSNGDTRKTVTQPAHEFEQPATRKRRRGAISEAKPQFDEQQRKQLQANPRKLRRGMPNVNNDVKPTPARKPRPSRE